MDIEEQTESNLRVHKENEVRVRDIAFKEGYAQGLKDASSPQHNLSNSRLAVDKNAELLYAADVDLTDIPLSVRAYNGLTRAGIKTVGDIALAHEKTNGLTSVWGLGVKTIDEIAQVLKSRYGITLPVSEAELSILKSGKNEEPSQA
jgi:DNA-directed RNA polymerase alpha subunit